MAFPLTTQQQTAVDNRGGSLLVSAAAGSGKTRVLVERVMARVMKVTPPEVTPRNLDDFLIITFTKAAAAELRGRILEELNTLLAEDPDNVHLQRQQALIYRTQISTIHSFCQLVLKEEGHQVELDPDFRVADEMAVLLLKRQVLERLMEQHYQRCQDNPEAEQAFAHLLNTLSAGRDDKKLLELVLKIHNKVQSFPYPHQWLEEQRSLFRLEQVTSVAATPWGQAILEESLAQVRYWQGELGALLQTMQEDGTLDRHIAVVETFLTSLDAFAAGLQNGWEEARQASQLNYGKFTATKKNANKALAARATALKSRCKDRLEKVTERFNRSEEAMLEDLRLAAPATLALIDLLQEFDHAITREKRRRKLVDFGDLEHLALAILVQDGKPTPAARRYQQRYAEVMVDEYQDTNQVQNAIFNAITDSGRKLFMVGDVKQSIYRFRLADPSIFLGYLDSFRYHDQVTEGEPRKVIMSGNFRSRKAVLDATNFIFQAVMSRDFGGMDYTDDHRLLAMQNYPAQPLDAPELCLVDATGVHALEGQPDPTLTQLELDYVARRIRALKDAAFPVTQGQGFRPVEWSDIVILHRSPKSIMPELTEALDRYRVPWQTGQNEDFFAATEVMVAMSYLQIIDNPHQDIPLISVLRSPLYSFPPDLLAEIRTALPEGDFYTALCACAEGGNAVCRDFLEQLAELRFLSTDRTASALLWALYENTAMLPIYTGMTGGEARRDNLILLYEYARGFEQNGYRGVFDFLTRMRQLQEQGQRVSVKTANRGGVQIMSIHGSKGLEFPVVLLPGLFREFNIKDEQNAVLFHDKLGLGPRGMDLGKGIRFPTLASEAVRQSLRRDMCAEELRLLYVAMTRAREKLIMVGCFKSSKKSDALAELQNAAAFPMHPQALHYGMSMGDWVVPAVMTRPEAACLRREEGITPLYTPAADEAAWQIQVLNATCPGTRTPDESTPPEAESWPVIDTEKLRWVYPWREVAEVPSKLTATQLKGRFRDEEVAEGARPERRSVTFRRPDFTLEEKPLSPAERGTALHLFMELCDPEKAATPRGAREELARLAAKGCMTQAQARSCRAEKAAAFFASPLGRQARTLGMQREFKFSLLSEASRYYGSAATGEKVLLQGVVDLWFRTLEGIVVVDFKTDNIAPGGEAVRAEQYRSQMEVYTSALEVITSLPVVHRYLWFFRTDTAFEL